VEKVAAKGEDEGRGGVEEIIDGRKSQIKAI
jgi:hypothetical protein